MDNPDSSLQKDSQEGRLPSSVDLVQIIVADQGLFLGFNGTNGSVIT